MDTSSLHVSVTTRGARLMNNLALRLCACRLPRMQPAGTEEEVRREMAKRLRIATSAGSRGFGDT